MNKFTQLIITPNSMQVKGGELNFADGTRLLLSAQNKLVTDIIATAPPEDLEEIRQAIYDSLNVGYGRMLEGIFPDLHNAHITPDFIAEEIEKEDEVIRLEYDEHMNVRQIGVAELQEVVS